VRAGSESEAYGAFCADLLRQHAEIDPHDSGALNSLPRIVCDEKEGSGEHETRPERSRLIFSSAYVLPYTRSSAVSVPFTFVRIWVRHCTYAEATDPPI